MRGFRPSYFDEADTSRADLLRKDRAKRMPRYTQRVD
jgi:hypothetical protein